MPLLAQLWSSWAQTADTAVRTLVVYVIAVVLIRVAGRRTLAQLSAYDVVVTVAAGTVVGSAALPSQPSVSDGVTVILTLFLLQVVLGALRQRFGTFQSMTDFRPLAVVRDGRPDLSRAPTSSQLTTDDLSSLLRRKGITDLSQVELAVLEPTGKVSVLRRSDDGRGLFDRV